MKKIMTIADSIESRLNKQVYILDDNGVNDLIDNTSLPWHEFYIRSLNTKVEIKQDIMRLTYLVYTLQKDYKGVNKKHYKTITIDNLGCFRQPVLSVIKHTISLRAKEKETYNFMDYIYDVVSNKETYNSKLTIKEGFTLANKVFDPFDDYKKVDMEKEKFTKMDVVKILVNNQHDVAKCDGFYTDDYLHDTETNYSKGIIGNLYLAKKIVEDNLPIMFQRKENDKIEIHVGYQSLSYVVYI